MTRISGTVHEDLCTFIVISYWILRMRNVWEESCRENKNTHFVFFFVCVWKLCCLWDNVEKYGKARQATDDNLIQCMHFACWLAKATYTLKMCNNYCSSTATVVLWTCLNVMFICTWRVLYISVFSIPLNVLLWELSGPCNQKVLCSEILVPLRIIILCNKKVMIFISMQLLSACFYPYLCISIKT